MLVVLAVTAGFLLLWILRQLLPVRQLSFVEPQNWEKSKSCTNIKLLDIRDASEFQHVRLPCSVNISLGRLPFTWQKALSPEECVVIVSNHTYKSKRAARILRKKGFRQLYAVRGNLFSRESVILESFKTDCSSVHNTGFEPCSS